MKHATKPSILQGLPIFALNSVLFPDGALSLKVFEARYLEMLSQCEKNNKGFGICLIENGSEVGKAAQVFPVGTLVGITFWEHRPDGLLGISVKGLQKFRLLDSTILDNQLIVADVALLDSEPEHVLPEQYQPMSEVLERIFSGLQHPYITLTKKYHDPVWLGSRLSELLPLPTIKKQQLLEMSEPMGRLAMLYDEMLNMGLLSD